MQNLNKIPTIRKLAKEFGTPLSTVDFIGDGVNFVYSVNGKPHSHYYSNAERGIDEEVERLERLLTIEV